MKRATFKPHKFNWRLFWILKGISWLIILLGVLWILVTQ